MRLYVDNMEVSLRKLLFLANRGLGMIVFYDNHIY